MELLPSIKSTVWCILYLDILSLINPVTAQQSKGVATKVRNQNPKQFISEMFSTELKFTGDCQPILKKIYKKTPQKFQIEKSTSMKK